MRSPSPSLAASLVEAAAGSAARWPGIPRAAACSVGQSTPAPQAHHPSPTYTQLFTATHCIYASDSYQLNWKMEFL